MVDPWNSARYRILDTREALELADGYLMEDGEPRFPMMAYDTETNGLHLYKTVMIGFSFSTDSKSGYYVPLLYWRPDPKSEKLRSIDKVKQMIFTDGELECAWTGKLYPEFVTPDEYQAPDFIKKYAKRWFSKVNLIMHNAPFDVNHTLVNLDVDLAANVLMDTALLAHIINENTLNGLKEVATEFKTELGYQPHAAANAEQKELGSSIIRNGGTYNARTKHVWRGAKQYLDKYAIADTFLTFGVYEVLMEKFIGEFGEGMLPWLFEDEVMPVCKEVVIPMKRRGVYIDVPYFKELQTQTAEKLFEMEDLFYREIEHLLGDFTKGKPIDQEISEGRLIKRIIQMEGLALPKKLDKKTGIWKETLGKSDVKKVYQTDPHWIWGYILGEDEIKYSESKIRGIKAELYYEVTGHRYQFNLASDVQLRWLFCDKLGMDETKLPQTDSATKDNPIPSMSAEVLEEHMLEKFPWVKHLMLFKKLSKLQGTYIEPAIALNLEGWLFMDMRQNGTISGRFSCSGGFNLQTLPKVEEIDVCLECKSKKVKVTHPMPLLAHMDCPDCKHQERNVLCPSAIKRGFIAPPGYKITNADYSSLEPRCFAFVSGDKKLKQVYWDNLDLYSKVYCDMMGEKYSDLKKAGRNSERNLVKPVILGIPYGARDPQVANLMNLKKKIKVENKETGLMETKEILDVKKGKEYRDLYLKTYPGLKRYMEKQDLAAITDGFVTTLAGRRRHFEYTVAINEQLMRGGVDIEAFLDAKYDDLEKHSVHIQGGNLMKNQLEILCRKFDMQFSEVMEKGGWAYIRGLFKNEQNNSKNFPIQALAGHIANRGMLDVNRGFVEKDLDAWVFLMVHDEISCYVREDQVDSALKIQKKGMEENKYAKMIDIPMIAEPIACSNLKDSK
jgi:DNA polymerase I-like protein with 3'-5' exonuclease and polymerase domains